MFNDYDYVISVEDSTISNMFITYDGGFISLEDPNFEKDVLRFRSFNDAFRFMISARDIVKYYAGRLQSGEDTLEYVRNKVASITCEDNFYLAMIIDAAYPDINKEPNESGCYNINLSIRLTDRI